MHYLLKDKEVIPFDLMTWAKSFDSPNRFIAKDSHGKVKVSTVFLGLDHGFGGSKPLLFETMVFGGPLDQEMDRYSTYDEAVAGHTKMLHKVRQAKP